MPGRKTQVNPTRSAASAHRPKAGSSSSQPPTVSARWLAAAIAVVLVAAASCAWGVLCLVVWQGSWQLLYHPSAALTRTPVSVGIAFNDLGFAASEAGLPRLQGWWIPAAADARNSRYTAIYLHGANGNLGNSVDALSRLHSAGLNVLAFDYRGYGQSQFVHPSEARWREDAESAIRYLTDTRHVAPNVIVLVGSGLGANLALEVAAAHPDLAGVVLDQPLQAPANAIFSDPRTHLVPAHALVKDRWDSSAAAAELLIPSLWFQQEGANASDEAKDFKAVTATRMLVWLPATGAKEQTDYMNALVRWLDGLPGHP
jgi:pimeloyl-ACP methyl ester carboxylesterase